AHRHPPPEHRPRGSGPAYALAGDPHPSRTGHRRPDHPRPGRLSDVIRIEKDGPVAVPRDSSTVILLRDEDAGFSVFMVRRHGKSGFMAGAYVFPGGTLDEADRAPSLLAHVGGRSAEEAARALAEDDGVRALALHVAALRETFEEAGVLL